MALSPIETKMTAANGAIFEIKKDETGALFLCVSGAPVQPALNALGVTSINFPIVDVANIQKIASFLLKAIRSMNND